MRHTEAIKKVMIDTGRTQQDIADALGQSRAVVSGRINGANITMKSLLEVMGAVGYEVVLRPKADGNLPEGQYAIRLEDYEGKD